MYTITVYYIKLYYIYIYCAKIPNNISRALVPIQLYKHSF